MVPSHSCAEDSKDEDLTSNRRPAVDDLFLSNRVLDYTASESSAIQEASSKLVCHLLRHQLDPELPFRDILDHIAKVMRVQSVKISYNV